MRGKPEHFFEINWFTTHEPPLFFLIHFWQAKTWLACMSWFQVRPRHVKRFWKNWSPKYPTLVCIFFFEFRTCRYWDGPISACLGFTWNQDMQILAQSWFWKLRLIYIIRISYMFPFLLIGGRKYLSQNRCPTNICMSWFQVRPRHVKGFWTNLATKVSHLGLHNFFEFRTCRYWDGPISACPGFTWNQDMQILVGHLFCEKYLFPLLKVKGNI